MSNKIITADEASQAAGKGSTLTDLILNDIYSKIRKASSAKEPEISLSYMIPRGRMAMMEKKIQPALEANGYTISIIKYKKIAPIMDNVGVLLVGW